MFTPVVIFRCVPIVSANDLSSSSSFAVFRRAMAMSSCPPPRPLICRAVPSPSSTPSTLGTDHSSLNRTEGSRIFSVISDNFREDVVARRYRLDGLSSRDWLLVYNYRVASFFFSLGRYAIAFLFVVIAICLNDFVRVGGGKFTIKSLQKLHNEIIALGTFGNFFMCIIALLFLLLIRIRMLFLGRIYVHRTEPNRICASIAKGIFSKKLVELDRTQIHVVPPWLKMHDSPVETGWGSFRAVFGHLFSFLWHSDIQLDKHGARMLYADGFRTNALRNWTLNERDTVPKRELKQSDLNLEGADAKWRRNLQWWQKILHLF